MTMTCDFVCIEIPVQLVPLEYQGYVLLGFMVFSAFALAYGIYLIATDQRVGVIPDWEEDVEEMDSEEIDIEELDVEEFDVEEQI